MTTMLVERRCELEVQFKRKATEQSARWWSDTIEPPAVRRKVHAEDSRKSNTLTLITEEGLNVKLPDPVNAGVSPGQYLLDMVQALWGEKLEVKKCDDLKDYFLVVTEKQMAAYNMTVTSATRLNQVEELRALLNEKGRDALDCYNLFGDGLLNIACRRGFKDVVKFLLSDGVQLDVHVHDDFGRTPMHDACWNSKPQLEICDLLMKRDPSLFLVADKRCFTPFHYARKCDWHTWRQFIFDRRHLLKKLVLPETLCKFSATE